MRVTAEEIEQAKEIPLIDFVDASGLDVEQEGKQYRLKDHDSLVITGNKFYWNSQQEGGYGAISFAMTYYDMKFPEAVKHVNEYEYGQLTKVEQQNKEPFTYPKHYETNNTQAMEDYLVNERKIDKRVVDWCVKKDLLVQDMKQNAVFKWKDKNNEVVGADRQGTTKIDNKRGTYKNVIQSSKDDGGFTIDVGKNPNKVALFESPVDMLSYWSVKKEQVQNTKMVSMSGLKTKAASKAMADIKEDTGKSPDQIMICVDNDKAGNEFHDKLNKIFKTSVVKDERPEKGKDWNDQLKLETDQHKSKQSSQTLAQGM